ncbi:MAG: amidohydrolase family protein [Gemmatimonadales bacterium]|nr:amidohydrolase family protein [Gemmatimonadales bacterium]
MNATILTRRLPPTWARGLATLLVLAGCRSAAETAPDLVLANVTVIDGLGGAPTPGRTIEIRGGRITAIRAARPNETSEPAVAGRFVIPGLIDSHVHLGHHTTELAPILDSLLRRGVTSVREMACCADRYPALDSQADSTPTPRIFFSAFWADSNFFAVDPRVRTTPRAGKLPWFLGVDDSTDLPAAIRAAKASGATGVKIYSNLSARLVSAVTAEAHVQGMRVWSHPVVFPTRPSLVVGAGVDVISHASLLVWEGADTLPDDYDRGHPFNPFGPPAPYASVPPDAPAVQAVLTAMRERGTILDATVSTVRRSVSEAAFAWAVRVTADAHRMGIPLAAGTDQEPFVGGHPALLAELEVLTTDVGLTPLEVLTTATRHGARALGLETSLGSIEVGKTADLVVLAGDPAQDVRHLREVVHVIKGGRLVR